MDPGPAFEIEGGASVCAEAVFDCCCIFMGVSYLKCCGKERWKSPVVLSCLISKGKAKIDDARRMGSHVNFIVTVSCIYGARV
jgi:hypothetical protein